MQSRNMAEAQGDLSIRGGTFENTGIQVGSATLMDPQTGHYTTELPIAPEMLGEPKVLTGADNALRGFNSSVGTVSYSWSEITKRGSLTVGGGDHNLNFQRLHNAWTGTYKNSVDWTWGAEIESSRSESDGTIPFGDHEFDRTSGRIQLLGPNSQTDFFAGFQKKFFGWPELYAAPYGSNETEDIKTNLYILNHEHFYGEQSHWEASAYHRLNNDHYIYDRFIPDQKYIHETKVTAFSISGLHVMGDNTAINYAIQVISDEINSTTLEEGKFTSRDYYKLSILPEYRYDLSDQKSITIKAGATLDDTNRDKYKISPIAEINWSNNDSKDSFERTYLSYAQTTQAVGYGAIGGKTTGLFASNPNLKRETSKNLELGYALQRKKWKVNGAIFHRWDQDLVDWVYQSTSPNSRSAKHLDIKTFGIEVISTREWANFELIGSYSYLHKTEDYKDPNIDGSFYALNFPENRITLGFIWNPNDLFQIRMDNEWREQRENIIREGPNQSTYSHIAASYYPSQIDDLEAFIAFDKPWDEEFQDIPGTPGRGDQFSLGATYRW
ncbi:MAG: TonB-dependent receptor [Opitutae bacterium]|nr:TonB-dependent receptor [Opitutae bacterium]